MDTASAKDVELLGLRFNPLTERSTADTVVERIQAGRGGQIYAANLDVLRLCRDDPEMRASVNRNADLMVADGTPLIWASRVGGNALPERVAGSTLLFTLSRAAAAGGASIFLLGGNEGAAEAAAARLRAESPDLEVAGWHFPPFGFENDPRERSVIESRLQETKPDVVFVGLPFEKQVAVMPEFSRALPDAWIMGVGISFSFASGEVNRAPHWIQNIGMEWLHRLVQEPRRLARRYLLHGPPTLFRLFVDATRTRLGRRSAGTGARL